MNHRSPWYHVRIVFLKEALDNWRDRRSMALGLAYPLLGPILLGVLINVAATNLQRAPKSVMQVAVAGQEHAPDLIAFLRDRDIVPIAAPDDPARAVREGELSMVMVIPPEAATDQSYRLKFYVDPGRVSTNAGNMALAQIISQFGRERARDLVGAVGLDPSVLMPITIEQINVGQDGNIALVFYRMMPPLFIFMIFLGGIYLAIDATAGERERGSFEPLLTAPVERWALLLGKSLSALAFTALVVAVNLTGFKVILSFVAAGQPSLTPPPPTSLFLLVFLLSIPLMMLAVTLQIAIAAITRSMKEAQIYLGLLPVVPALPGMVLSFSPLQPHLWTAFVPVLGQMLMFQRLVAGESVDPLHAVISILVTVGISILLFRWAVRLFQRERLFFLG